MPSPIIIYVISAAVITPIIIGYLKGAHLFDLHEQDSFNLYMISLLLMMVSSIILPIGILYLIGNVPATKIRRDKEKRQEALDDLRR